MRVITGKYKGRHFDVPRTFKARPTTDFAKESLFNVLQGYMEFEEDKTMALDLFAGTGSITLEILSRGCRQVVAVEKEPLHCRFINQYLQQLKENKAIVLRADVFKYLNNAKAESFDFIFADPPYDIPDLALLPDKIFSDNSSILKPGGIFVLEHGKRNDFSSHQHFVEHRAYGSVNFSLFR
ncbi:MAG: RsmD family RNA methyltransferase [Bacteroidaceae bacterium]|nr:RsmD family RNA methyltransferase [Bacteroidaceae bacterium]